MALLPDGPIDTLGYRETASSLPDRIEAALDVARPADLPPATDIDHVHLVATSPLASALDFVAVTAAPVVDLPLIPVRGGVLPASVTPRSLVVVLGADESGPADGPAVESARARGAHVVVLDVGAREQIPRLGAVPAAVGVLAVLQQLGQFAELEASVSAAAQQLRLRVADAWGVDAPLRRLARRVGRTLPLVYASDPLGGAAAVHWKRQVNAGAKSASFANRSPEIDTGELAGWGQHGDMTRQVFSLVVLRHDHEPAGTDERMARLQDLVDEVVHERHVVDAAGAGSLAQLLDLVFQGDVFAYHLAQELEIDPGPVATLTST